MAGIVFATVLVLVCAVAILWILSRRAAQLKAGIAAVQLMRDRIELLSKQTPQPKGSAKLVSTEVETVLEELRQITHLPPGLIATLKNKETAFHDLSAALTALERHFNMQKRLLLAQIGISRGLETSFKALGIALVGAVLLAGSGIIFLGSQSVNLHDSLNQAAEEKRKSLDDLTQKQQGVIKTQSSAAQDAIKSAQKTAEDAKSKLDDTVKKFELGSKDLENRAIAAAISSVKSALDARTQELSKHLEDTANAASIQLQGSIEDAQKRLSTINTGIADVETRITDVENGIRDANSSITALSPQIERLKQQNVLDEGNLATFSSLRLQVTAAASSADAARSAAQRATDAVNAAATALAVIEEDRKRGAATVVSLETDARSHMDTINRLLDQISHAGDLQVRLVRVEALVADLEQRTQKQEQTTPKQSTTTQGNLSRCQWKKIQRSLTAQGFNPGRIDGRPGPITVNAIREYQKQRSDHPDVTGTLTDNQVDDLLK